MQNTRLSFEALYFVLRTDMTHNHYATQNSTGRSAQQPEQDPYYGFKDIALICARYICDEFNSIDYIPAPEPNETIDLSASGRNGVPIPATLAHFIAYVIFRTEHEEPVLIYALALLRRLKHHYPAIRAEGGGHRLFLPAFMIASKFIIDDPQRTYTNKSWVEVGQFMFPLRILNQMETTMCSNLEWNYNIPANDLRQFWGQVRSVYRRPPPYRPDQVVNSTLQRGTGDQTIVWDERFGQLAKFGDKLEEYLCAPKRR